MCWCQGQVAAAWSLRESVARQKGNDRFHRRGVTMQREPISWIPLVVSFVFVGICSVFVMPRKSEALPQFARRYNLKCTACHTIVPVLNEQGELFQRLGYHLPPALQPGEVPRKLSAIPE